MDEGAPARSDITIVAVEPRRIAMVRRTVAFSDLPAAQRAARALLDAARKQAGIDVGLVNLTLWRPAASGAMDYAPAIFVPDGFRASGPVTVSTLPQGRAAHLRMHGPYAGLPEAWKALFVGIAGLGLVPAGQNWEIYAAADVPPEAAGTDLYALLA